MAETRSRARSTAERTRRREAILDAAESLVLAEGLDGVSMHAVARRAGLAKGTLYLYFRTREEVFLAVFARHRERWTADLLRRLDAGEKLVPLVLALAVRHPVFHLLNARVAPVIEQNLPVEALYAEKRATRADFDRVVAALARRYRVAPDTAAAITVGFVAAMQGACALSSWRPPADTELPDDVAGMFALSRFETVFATTADLVLRGAGVSE